MANPEHVQLLLASVADNDGCKAWNEWRYRANAHPDLAGAQLGGMLLRGADLRGAILLAANLEKADLLGADLTGAKLDGADLRGANIGGVSFRWASLVRVNLEGTEGRADFFGAGGLTEDQKTRIITGLRKSWE